MLVKVILAPVHAVLEGVKVTFTETLSPAPRVTGRLVLDTLNWESLTLMAEIVELVCPVLVTVMS